MYEVALDACDDFLTRNRKRFDRQLLMIEAKTQLKYLFPRTKISFVSSTTRNVAVTEITCYLETNTDV